MSQQIVVALTMEQAEWLVELLVRTDEPIASVIRDQIEQSIADEPVKDQTNG